MMGACLIALTEAIATLLLKYMIYIANILKARAFDMGISR